MLNLERQSGIIPTGLIKSISATIVGCGAIGSHVAETFGKIGISNLVVYDFDTVEEHNLPNQGFRLSDLGRQKTLAIKDRLETSIGITVDAKPEKVTEETVYDTTIVVSAVDSMSARTAIWEGVKKSEGVSIFIDGRMGAMFGQVYLVHTDQVDEVKAYETTLFSDEDAYQAPCTEKATIFCAVGLAAWMTSMYVAVVCSEGDVPSLLEVDFGRMEVMQQKIEG